MSPVERIEKIEQDLRSLRRVIEGDGTSVNLGVLGVLEEHLVEIAEPEEENSIGTYLAPHSPILPHHGRCLTSHTCNPPFRAMRIRLTSGCPHR